MGGIVIILGAKLVNFMKDYDPQSDIGASGGKTDLILLLFFIILLLGIKDTNHKEKNVEEETEEEE